MADICKFVWGSRVLDMTAPPYSLIGGITVRLAEPDVTLVVPATGATIVSALRPTDRVIEFAVKINTTSAATAANALTDIKLLVDGDNQIAANEDESPVYLALERNAGNGTMLHRVRWGNVDDGTAHFSEFTQGAYAANGVRIRLVVESAGLAETAITLRNRLVNGDFALAAAGLATSWTLIGAPTAANETTSFLINGRSQKITAASANLGLGSEDIANVSSAAGYMWVRITSGSVVVALRDITGGSDLDNAVLDATDSNSVSDMTAKDDAGNTWYRVPVSWSGSSTTVDLAARSSGGAATFFVDAAYLATGTTTVPNAWSSYYAISNRADRTTTNPTYVNYIDYWGVPGDMPAFLKMNTDSSGYSSSNPLINYWSKATDALYSVANAQHWAESDQGSYAVATGGTGAWSDRTGTTDNHYKRFTEGVTNNGGYVEFGSGFFALTDTTVNAFWSIPRRVLALCRANTTNVTITGSVVMNFGGTRVTVESNDATGVGAANNWEWVDLGVMNRVGAFSADSSSNVTVSMMSRIDIDGLANTETFDIDAVLFLYAQDDGLMTFTTRANGNQIENYRIAGQYESVLSIGNASDIADATEVVIGNCWTVAPGNRVTRTVWAFSDDEDTTVITANMGIETTLTPRSRLLLGHQKYLGGV